MPRKVTKPKAVTKSASAARTAPATVVVNDTGKGLKVAVVATNADDLKGLERCYCLPDRECALVKTS
jgi:hypothetical protein